MAKGKDAATGGSPQQVMIDADALAEYGRQIAELDAKIASASGSDTVAKKAFVEQLITNNADQVNSITDNLISQLGEVDLPVLAGLLTKLEERLKADLAPKVEDYVNTEFPKTQTTSKEDVEGLKVQRKELLVQFKALREVLNTFKIPNDHVPDPKRSGGGRPAGSGGGGSSKTGANKEGYRYFIDGKKRPRTQNSFSSVAFYATDGIPALQLKEKLTAEGADPADVETKAKAAPKKLPTKDLKDFIVQETGADFGTLDEWEVTLPNGKKVSARRYTDEDKVDLGIVGDANETGDTDGQVEAEASVGVSV